MSSAYSNQHHPRLSPLHGSPPSRLWVWLAWFLGLGSLALLLALAPLIWGLLVVFGLTGAIVLLLRPERGLYLLAFTIPFGSLYPLKLGSFTLEASDILVMVVALGWFLRLMSSDRNHLVAGRLALALGCFLLTLLLALLPAQNMPEAFKELAKWLEFLVILLFIINEQSKVKFDVMLVALFVAAILEGLLGIYQFLSGKGPASFIFLGRYIRSYGTFGQPNPFGGYMGLVLPLAYSTVVIRWRQALPGKFGSTLLQSMLWWLALLAGGVMLTALLMSGSRGALLGLFAGVLTVILVSGKRIWLILAILVVVIMAVGPTILTIVPSAYLMRVADIFQLSSLTNLTTVEITDANFALIERAAHWLAAWRMFSLHPWLGIGLGQYATVYPLVAIPRWSDPLGHAHNYLLNILAEGGMVSLTGYLVFSITALVSSIRVAYSKMTWRKSLGLAAVGMWTALFVHNLFDNLYVHGMYLLVAIVFGMIAALAMDQSKVAVPEEST
jgi:putative inorganic carbon (HCO3(-)) transporter